MTENSVTVPPAAYRGRFAPTPSGPLHLGSLLTAIASFLQARSQRGSWLLRLDDLDAARCPPGMAEEILRQLEAHGLVWDEAPRRQSRHLREYEGELERLRSAGLLYACDCSRRRLASESRAGPDGPVYDGRCRTRQLDPMPSHALRFRVDGELRLDDPWRGWIRRDLGRDIGDFVVRRSDGWVAYQLACVVDEKAQRVTEVIRGADLLGSSFRQLSLMRALRQRPPSYRHLPVVTDAAGRKLSKQNHAVALDSRRAAANLIRCLGWLNQSAPQDLSGASPQAVLAHALEHWDPEKVRYCGAVVQCSSPV